LSTEGKQRKEVLKMLKNYLEYKRVICNWTKKGKILLS
jgi:hypothetical protein